MDGISDSPLIGWRLEAARARRHIGQAEQALASGDRRVAVRELRVAESYLVDLLLLGEGEVEAWVAHDELQARVDAGWRQIDEALRR